MTEELQHYLQPTFFLDYRTKCVADFAASVCRGKESRIEKGVALYYAVRDGILYDPYDLKYSREAMTASAVLQKKSGYCVSKAVLLAAVGRHQEIPCRLGFADVTNHLSTERLRKLMGTDLFVYHGYTEMYLEGKWVKATPAFNLSLCTRFRVVPLEFDGTEDSIFHQHNADGLKHMEYVKDHGHFDDLPFERIFTAYASTYPQFMENFGGRQEHDFSKEAELENRLVNAD